MSALLTVGDELSFSRSPEVGDDSLSESEILFRLCKKIIDEAYHLTQSMRSCISDCEMALNRQISSDSISENETPFSISIFDDMLSESELEVVVPDSFLDESMVCETEFDVPLPESEEPFSETENPGAAKHSDGEDGASMAEQESRTVVESKVERSSEKLSPILEEILGILLPSYRRLV